MTRFRTYLTLAGALLLPAAAMADAVADARALLEQGEYTQALENVRHELTLKANRSRSGALSQIAGEAAYYLGLDNEAEEYFGKARSAGVADAYLFSGRMAFSDYDFPQAAQYFSRYLELKEKASKEADPAAEKLKERSVEAQDMLERVEQIQVFDRIDTDRDSFFAHYRLSPESGRLIPAEKIEKDYPGDADITSAASPVFENEGRDFRLWSQIEGDEGTQYIYESSKLIGGDWSAPQQADTVLNMNGDAAFPFMMADGTTLYFASNGDGSIGGYDIFRSNRDSETAEYQAPVNMGMPYNSPANDYLLAIDESTGIGWWATDRNRLSDDKITIYLFVPNDLRRNYNTDETENLASLARIDNIEETWDTPDADFSSLKTALEELSAAATDTDAEQPDFIFPMGGGKAYRFLSDFRNPQARSLMERYLRAEKELASLNSDLAALRREWQPGSADSQRILQLEAQAADKSAALKELRNAVIKAEK